MTNTSQNIIIIKNLLNSNQIFHMSSNNKNSTLIISSFITLDYYCAGLIKNSSFLCSHINFYILACTSMVSKGISLKFPISLKPFFLNTFALLGQQMYFDIYCCARTMETQKVGQQNRFLCIVAEMLSSDQFNMGTEREVQLLFS